MKKSIVFYSSIMMFLVCLHPTSAQYFNLIYDNASLLGKENKELSVHYSGSTMYYKGDNAKSYDDFNARFGVGISDFMDIRLNYSRITYSITYSNTYYSRGMNYLEIAPKFSLSAYHLALFLPFGIYFDSNNDLKVFTPKLLFTFPSNNKVEVSLSTGGIIPLRSNSNAAINFNFGFGFSSDLQKWSIRPEIGFLEFPNKEFQYLDYGIGFNYHFH